MWRSTVVAAVAGAQRLGSLVNHDHDSFSANHADVTFVGRPFPLEDALDHFARLTRQLDLTFSVSVYVFIAYIQWCSFFHSPSPDHMGGHIYNT